jgi:hypothetical protein
MGMMMNRTHWITVGFLVVVIFAAFTAHAGAEGVDKQPTITTDKQEYKCGETVTILYDFINEPQKEVIYRISIYQDPSFILHVVTWDGGMSGIRKWETEGLWDGTYYIVAKHHRPAGLLYEEEIVALSKFSLISGAKHQQSLLSILNAIGRETPHNQPTLTPYVFNIQKQEVVSWLTLA